MSVFALLVAGSAAVAMPSWLSEQALLGYLGSSSETVIPLAEIVPPQSATEICVMVGIYARHVPDHIPAVEAQLVDAHLLPVAEGSGLVFSVVGDQLVQAAVFDVWGTSPVLELPDDATCYPVQSGTLKVWRFGSDGIRLTFLGI